MLVILSWSEFKQIQTKSNYNLYESLTWYINISFIKMWTITFYENNNNNNKILFLWKKQSYFAL